MDNTARFLLALPGVECQHSHQTTGLEEYRHEENDAGSILLTAKPEELQDFLVKYGDDKEAYNDYYDKIWLKKTDH